MHIYDKAVILSLPIEELELGVRAYNVLRRNGINTVTQMMMVTLQDVASWPDPMGLPAIKQLTDAMEFVDSLVGA